VNPLQPRCLIFRDSVPGFSQQRVNEQTTTHTDLAMDTPDGEVDAAGLQCLSPCEDVLVNAIHERTVKVK
jgi:hypothetical protein